MFAKRLIVVTFFENKDLFNLKIKEIHMTNQFKTTLLLLLVTISTVSFAQDKEELIDWHLRDLSSTERGTNVEKAYRELLNNQSPKEKIIVAVIDSGIDINHEDLKDVIWVNTDEIPGNGIDDDKNGYIDDVNGWNFLGNPNGEMVGKDNLEVTREYSRLSKQWQNKSALDLSKQEMKEWKYFQRVKNEFEEGKLKAEKSYQQFNGFYTMYTQTKSTLQEILGEDFSAEELAAFEPSNEEQAQAQAFFSNMLANDVTEDYVQSYKDYVMGQKEWYYNPDVDVRRDIIKDDVTNLYEVGYGNNNVYGPEADHGTHVAGIIAAVRNNKIGMNGVANNVLIMPVRAVPGGDEHDKDVANAIKYAVDNGARVINMSFGKSFSPHEAIVAEAIQYAEDNGVLLINAAGNDGKDIDENISYPTNFSQHIRGKVKTFITVGASSIHPDETFPASFTNYGDTKVDIFAPGVDIYSSTPENNYEYNNGTSMAAPVVSGVAALILSYYPDLNGKQVKKILQKSASIFDSQTVNLPGSKEQDDNGEDTYQEVAFSELSSTAGLINAYEALILAAKKSKY